MDRSFRRSFLAGLLALGIGLAGSFAAADDEPNSCPVARAEACNDAALGPTLERVAWGLVKHALS